MTHRFLLISLMALLSGACSNYVYYESEEASPLSQSEAERYQGLDIPDAEPLREPYTTYMKVTSGGEVVGYIVRYDPIPVYAAGTERRHGEGTIFVEDQNFERMGFISRYGRAYLFRGADAEEIGRGTLDLLLPQYYGVSSVEVSELQ